ncbi:frizzled-3-like, partial [Nycticebus coucang]|uniref:frizzled-3-like n=1 Tax=Nycticebus coucang TaxID=9470 RepID=UPI00234CF969
MYTSSPKCITKARSLHSSTNAPSFRQTPIRHMAEVCQALLSFTQTSSSQPLQVLQILEALRLRQPCRTAPCTANTVLTTVTPLVVAQLHSKSSIRSPDIEEELPSQDLQPFHPMVNLDCSRDFRPFLCALYAPICMEYGRVTLLCRRLCQRAYSECSKLMEMFGVPWPEDMECSRCPDCDEPYPRLVDLNLAGDPTEGAPVAVQRDYGFWCPRELKIDPDLGYSFLHVRDCSPPCPNMYFRREELSFARYFIGLISIICLSATLFTFLTFLIDVTRFRYPERPIIFYAVCYMMVSLIFFIGFLLEDRVACNASSPGQYKASTVTQGSHNKACTMLFMVLYFFTMAGSVWWVILTITWFLAAVPKWGSEAIEKKALLFHASAWGIPGTLTIILLAMNKIEGD